MLSILNYALRKSVNAANLCSLTLLCWDFLVFNCHIWIPLHPKYSDVLINSFIYFHFLRSMLACIVFVKSLLILLSVILLALSLKNVTLGQVEKFLVVNYIVRGVRGSQKELSSLSSFPGPRVWGWVGMGCNFSCFHSCSQDSWTSTLSGRRCQQMWCVWVWPMCLLESSDLASWLWGWWTTLSESSLWTHQWVLPFTSRFFQLEPEYLAHSWCLSLRSAGLDPEIYTSCCWIL